MIDNQKVQASWHLIVLEIRRNNDKSYQMVPNCTDRREGKNEPKTSAINDLPTPAHYIC